MNNKIRLFFEFRIPLISYILIFIAVFISFLSGHTFQPLHTKLSQLGIIFIFLGFGIRVLSTITKRYMGKIKITGIYAVCRHPMLIGQFFAFVGFNIIVEDILFFVLSVFIFVINDVLSEKKYDKILAYHYKSIWKIYSSQTNFVLPFTTRINDVFKPSVSSAEIERGNNFAIFLAIYTILVEIATFSSI